MNILDIGLRVAVCVAWIAVAPASGVLGSITGGAITGGDARARGGRFIQLTPPLPNPRGATNSVGNNTFEDPNLYGFDENQNLIAGKALEVDLLPSGKSGMLPLRIEVASHYLFYDPPAGIPWMTGHVDFSDEIVGVITSRQNLIDSDYLARTGVNYLSPGKRGLESDDSIRIDSGNRKRLHLNFGASTPGDYIRVLTRRPPGSRVRWSGNGHYYEAVLAQGGITWDDANLIAVRRGGRLARIESSAENIFVAQLVKDARYWRQNGDRNWLGPWIGGWQSAGALEPNGGWQWDEGQPMIFVQWGEGQPNNSGGAENRVQLMGRGGVGSDWNDLSAADSQNAQGFVVEYEANPEAVPSIQRRGAGGRIVLVWQSHSSRTYTVLRKRTMGDAEWTIVASTFGNGEATEVEVEVDGSAAFFQIVD